MKRSFLIVLSLILLTSSCFAFGILTTGTTNGLEKWTVQAQYSTTGFTQSGVNGSLAGIGVRGTYGLTKDLDLLGEYWTGSYVVSDFDFSQAAGVISVGLKYGFLKVANNDPVDLAGYVNVASVTTTDLTWGINTIGISASKVLNPKWTAFGVAAVLMNSWKVRGFTSVSETDTMIGGGAKYHVNSTFSVLGEIDRFWLDSNVFQTISIAGEWVLQ